MHRPFRVCLHLSAALFAVLAALTTISAGELQTLSGKKLTGELVAADQKVVVFKAATGETSVPLADVLTVDLQNKFAPIPPNTPYIEVELVDGSLFHAKTITITEKVVEITLLNDRSLKLPLNTLASVLMNAHDAGVQAGWKGVLAKKSRFDRLIVKEAGAFDIFEGSFGDGSADGKRIAFTSSSGGKINPRLTDEKTGGLLFQQRLEGAIPPTLCKVTDSLRNVLVAKEHLFGAKGATITTVSGVAVTYPSSAEVVKFDYAKAKMQYLSDLKGTIETTDKDVTPLYFRDQSPEKGVPLKLKGKELRGLNLAVQPARTTLTFDIGGDYKELKAVVGVDDSIEYPTNAQVSIEVDGKIVYTADVKQGEEPKPVNLDVRNAKILRISVITDRLDLVQWVTLGDAKVSK